jgi:hypothetical protein
MTTGKSMSYFSRLAFDLMQLLDSGQKFQAQQRLFAEGCKNPNPQRRGLEQIAEEHSSRLVLRKHFGGVRTHSSRSTSKHTRRERLEETAKIFDIKL